MTISEKIAILQHAADRELEIARSNEYDYDPETRAHSFGEAEALRFAITILTDTKHAQFYRELYKI